MTATKCGYVAILGRPNVGKSTLLNRLLGQKVSITSKKPQTTRHHLLGIKTDAESQILYVDTPGIHVDEPRAINRYMNRSARSVAGDVDLVVFVLDRSEWNADDENVANLVESVGTRSILVINKMDLFRNKRDLLPVIARASERFPEAQIVPVSAETGENLDTLEGLVKDVLPAGPFYFPEDQITDRSERFMVSEILREKLMRQLGEEVPYSLTIQLDRFKLEKKTAHIDATIFVERDGQKAILIGKGGERLKRIGADARKDIESLLGTRVMLTTWVKVKSGWSDDERALKSLGYDDV